MKLELKSIKYSHFASRETYCFEGVLYLEGKPFAHVFNEGQGGADSVHYHENSPFIKKLTEGGIAWREKFQEIEEYFSSLPKTDVGKYDWAVEGFDQTLESWCHNQVCDYLTKKDLKRLLKRCIVAQVLEDNESRVVQWNKPKNKPDWLLKEHVKNKYPSATILNDISELKALEIYRST